MSEEKDLVLENTENAEEPTAEETVESEVSAAEEESETISYTQEELNQKVTRWWPERLRVRRAKSAESMRKSTRHTKRPRGY